MQELNASPIETASEGVQGVCVKGAVLVSKPQLNGIQGTRT